MNKKMKTAISLTYDGINTPIVSAKYYETLAVKLIEEMEKNGVLIHSDENLINWLNALEVGDEIPQSLYYVIAELIAYAWFLDGKTPPGWQNVSIDTHA